MRIVTIVGARPQFVKAAVISRAIKSFNRSERGIKEIIVHTGQHYDANMSDIFFKEMHIPEADYNLSINNCSHGEMTGFMLQKIEQILLKEKPQAVLVYGDTNSTLAGALAASKLHIPVAHVEAGLRSFNMDMPEEINRILTDRISSFLFCPTDTAVKNLCNEGFGNGSKILPRQPIVFNVGDVMYDATLFYRQIAKPNDFISKIITDTGNKYYLATIHREDNTDNYDRLKGIVDAFNTISKVTPIILPLHPRTKQALLRHKLELQRVTIIDPVGYFDMIALLDNCSAVFTDSGGLQKEAYFFKKPCVTLRDQTEWIELVINGYNTLVGAKKEEIVLAEQNLIFMADNGTPTLYGQGDAGEKIVSILANSHI
jgi:UDP-GlcNAc3NAcA epimerase